MKKLFSPILRLRKNKNDLFLPSTIVERTKETYIVQSYTSERAKESYIVQSEMSEMLEKTFSFHFMSPKERKWLLYPILRLRKNKGELHRPILCLRFDKGDLHRSFLRLRYVGKTSKRAKKWLKRDEKDWFESFLSILPPNVFDQSQKKVALVIVSWEISIFCHMFFLMREIGERMIEWQKGLIIVCSLLID